MKTDTITPKNKYSLSGTKMNHTKDDTNNAKSHRNELKISRIILIGESEIVKINIARGIPKAKNAQPKNSATVMIAANHSIYSQELNRRANSLIKLKLFFRQNKK